ncbi:hypothetical protein CR513_15601, partial [Mucuna pruriens]
MTTLPAKSIRSFNNLADSFVSQFATNKVKQLEVTDLFDIKQAKDESLKSYLARFNNATIRAIQKGLRAGQFSNTRSKPGHVTIYRTSPPEGKKNTNTA